MIARDRPLPFVKRPPRREPMLSGTESSVGAVTELLGRAGFAPETDFLDHAIEPVVPMGVLVARTDGDVRAMGRAVVVVRRRMTVVVRGRTVRDERPVHVQGDDIAVEREGDHRRSGRRHHMVRDDADRSASG
jgi:hypothetical protein